MNRNECSFGVAMLFYQHSWDDDGVTMIENLNAYIIFFFWRVLRFMYQRYERIFFPKMESPRSEHPVQVLYMSRKYRSYVWRTGQECILLALMDHFLNKHQISMYLLKATPEHFPCFYILFYVLDIELFNVMSHSGLNRFAETALISKIKLSRKRLRRKQVVYGNLKVSWFTVKRK